MMAFFLLCPIYWALASSRKFPVEMLEVRFRHMALLFHRGLHVRMQKLLYNSEDHNESASLETKKGCYFC